MDGDMDTYESRLLTFDRWPSDHPVRPESLARAGQIYGDKGDHTTCYVCKKELKRWKKSDDPYEEHKAHFPRCRLSREPRVSIPEPCKVNEYIIHDEIGRGAFGEVYKVKTVGTGEDLAMRKLSCPDNSSNKWVQEYRKVFDQKLEHVNVVHIREHFIIQEKLGQRVYIVMELCEEGNLGDYVIKQNPDLTERFRFMTEIASGVSYLHAQDVMHKNIKPENVLLKDTNGRLVCKITNVSLSENVESTVHLTKYTNPLMFYFAPETLDGISYSYAVDVFALGLLFYALHNNIIVDSDCGVKSLKPVKVHPSSRYEHLYVVIQRESPTEPEFVDTYFRDSSEMGRLVYSMVQTVPGYRPLIQEVLQKTTEAKVMHEMQHTTGDLLAQKVASLTCELSELKVKQTAEAKVTRDLGKQVADLRGELVKLRDEVPELKGFVLQLKGEMDMLQVYSAPKRSSSQDESWKMVLTRSRAHLVTVVDMVELWHLILAEDIATNIQVDTMKSKGTANHEHVGNLVDHLLKRSNADYEKFLQALVKTGQSHVVDYLQAEDK